MTSRAVFYRLETKRTIMKLKVQERGSMGGEWITLEFLPRKRMETKNRVFYVVTIVFPKNSINHLNDVAYRSHERMIGETCKCVRQEAKKDGYTIKDYTFREDRYDVANKKLHFSFQRAEPGPRGRKFLSSR